jgi:hypothetical protein
MTPFEELVRSEAWDRWFSDPEDTSAVEAFCEGVEWGAGWLVAILGMAEAIKARSAQMPCLECGAPTAAWRKFCDKCEWGT